MNDVYKASGTCSSEVHLDINGDVVSNGSFTGGCNGNLSGISRLVEGRKATEVADILKGTTCGFKNTSCPDQLSRALLEAVENASK